MLQLKRARFWREGGKILFPQGQSKVLSSTEWMVLKEIYKASLCRRLGSGKNIGKTKWKTQVAPAGPAGGADAVWEFWHQCPWFHLPLIPCTTSGKLLLSQFPNSPGYNGRINNIPLVVQGIQPQGQWNPPGWSQVHVITDIKSVTLNYCRFLLPDHLDHEIGL